MKNLVHYSGKPITAFGSVAQVQDTAVEARYLRKPRGLWFAEDSQWQDCAGSDLDDFTHKYDVTLGAGIIVLETIDDFDAFGERFGMKEDPSYGRDCEFIRWHDVAKVAAGIQLAVCPYRMLDVGDRFGWLWGWDIASGCVWDANFADLKDSTTGASVPKIAVHDVDRPPAKEESFKLTKVTGIWTPDGGVSVAMDIKEFSMQTTVSYGESSS